MEDWNVEYDSGKSDRFIKKHHWEKSSSEPDLTDPFNVEQRFAIKNPSEYISIDQLHYFRRKKPTDCHTKSNICLYDKDKPVLPFSIIKSEYKWRYKDPTPFLKSGLTRKATSLKLEGYMDIETEHKAKYIHYNEEQISRGRPPAIRNPENLTLDGVFEHNPEYKSSFVHHPASVRQKIYSPIETFKIHGEIEVLKEPISMSSVDIQQQPSSSSTTIINNKTNNGVCLPAGDYKTEAQKCHLKLEGEMSYLPEYRSQYISHDIEKSHSIPQLSNIHFNGTFTGIPEYRENYKFYDNYSKSAPIKKADHLILNGQVECTPEYKEQFKEPGRQKTELLKTEDHLKPEGDFGKDVPEYYESFKDPQVRHQMPEKGKCREPYLRLKGKIEFNPEYRSTYLDYPRSRPICKKSTSSFKIAGTKSKSPFGSPRKRFQSNSPLKYHDPNNELPLAQQPEYRKAKYIYQIRERTPQTRQIAEVQGTVKTSKKDKFSDKLNVKHMDNLNKQNRRQSVVGVVSSNVKSNLENIENLGEILPKVTPKYGRRASTISRNSKIIREKSSIIEGNPKYNKSSADDSSTIIDDSFVVLDEPCKKNAWMKKSWYET